MALTQADAALIAGEIARALKTAGITRPAGPAGPTSAATGAASFGSLADKAEHVTGGFTDLQRAVEHAKSKYDSLSQTIQENLNVWRDLSKTGASFSNDVVGMRAAAAGARLDIGEFAGVIRENSANMTGFGGDVSRGAEAFAKASRRMFDELGTTTDQLRQMGYTNKELNDILAITNISSRAQFKDEEERARVLTENATALAREMDLMAKLTGKSREDQMAQIRKNNADMAFEAALRSKMMEIDDPVKRAEFEKNARDQLREAQTRGQGQMFKEVFATGQIISKEAAQQASVLREQSQATIQQAQISRNAQMESDARRQAADQAAEQGRAAFSKDLNNKQLLFYASIDEAGGVPGKVMRDSMSAQIDYQRGLEAIAAKNNLNLKNEDDRAKAIQLYTESARKSQDGLNAAGQDVSGTTKAIVNLGARAADVESALYNKLVAPMNEKVSPAFTKLSETVLGANTALGEPFVKNIEKQLEKGFSGAKDAAGPVAGLGKAANTASDALLKMVDSAMKLTPYGKTPPGRNFGSLGATGKLFENFGDGTLVELHGMESVMRPEDLKKIVESSMGGMTSAMSKIPMTPGINPSAPAIDISKISETISTTVSSATSGAAKTVPMPNIGEMSKPFELAFKELTSKINFEEITKPFGNLFSKFTKDRVKENTVSIENTFDEFGKDFDKIVAKLTSDTKEAIPVDEFAGLDEAIAKQKALNDLGEFAGVDEAIAKQQELNQPYDEFAGLEEAISKVAQDIAAEMPFDEFAGLDEAIAKQKEYNDLGEFAGLDEAMARVAQDIAAEMPFDEFAGLDEAIAKQQELNQPYDEFAGINEAMARVAQDIAAEMPFDEFAGLDEAIAKQKEYNELGEFAGIDEAMARVAQDIAAELPFDEFGGLDEAIEEQKRIQKNTSGMDILAEDESVAQGIKMNPETGETYYTDKVASDINSELPFDEFAGLDEAIAKQKALNDLGEFAGLDEAIAKQAQMKDMIAGSSPTVAQQSNLGAIDPSSFTLSPTGMPIPKPKSTAAAIPEKKDTSYDDVESARFKRQAAQKSETATTETASATRGPSGSEGGKSTLDDVVKSLQALNMQVGQLISTSEQGFATVARSAKSNNTNLYERAKA